MIVGDLVRWTIARCKAPIRGVLHIGANTGQEAAGYAENGLNVIWIEADPGVFQSLQRHVSGFAGQAAYRCLASDRDGCEVDFHVASNAGGSSSILKPDPVLFPKEWPDIREVGSIRLATRRLDTLLMQRGSGVERVNLIVADVQGYELPVLRGLGSLIGEFEAVVAELNWARMYVGATKPHDLEAFLVERGFTRAWLGIGHPQATGVWIRRKAGWFGRLYMALSARLYFLAVRSGLIQPLRALGILGVGRTL